MRRKLILILKKYNINGRDILGFALSLLLAFSIWLVHNLSQNYTEVVRVYVQAKADIIGRAELSTSPIPINIRCRTRGFDIIKLKRSSIHNPIIVHFESYDFKHLKEDLYSITASKLSKYLPQILGNNVSSATFLVDNVVFKFAKQTYKKVAVQPVYQISYKSQYTNVGSLHISPDSVLVYGDSKQLNNIDKVYTKTFYLDNISSTVHSTIPIMPIKGVRISQKEVSYFLEVARYVEIIATVPIKVKNKHSGANLVVYPSTAEVKFRCAFPLNIDPKTAVKFYIDYNDYQASLNGKCLVKSTKLPEGVYGYSIVPEVFDCFEKGRWK